MIKNILHPGNGIHFPKKGDYVKVNLLIYDNNKTVLFDSNSFSKKDKSSCLDIRYGCPESNIIPEIEGLVGEMSLFERCSLEIDANHIKDKNSFSEQIHDLLKTCKKIIFEVEIVDISNYAHNK